MVDPVFMNLAKFISSPEPISTAYVINPSCQFMYPNIVTRQRPGKRNVIAARNSHATIEKLLDAAVYMRSVSYERSVLEFVRGIVGSVVFNEVCVVSKERDDPSFPEPLVCVLR
jgi:hypothetical protein